jgi:hypothetical protein
MLKIVLIGILSLINAVLSFLPGEKISKPALKYLKRMVALSLVFYFTISQIIDYKNFSYAKVSEDGEIAESRNFNYQIKRIKDERGLPEYLIVGKHNLDNLTISTNRAVSPELSIAQDGVLIKFIGVGYGNPMVSADFKIEILKR